MNGYGTTTDSCNVSDSAFLNVASNPVHRPHLEPFEWRKHIDAVPKTIPSVSMQAGSTPTCMYQCQRILVRYLISTHHHWEANA